MLIINDVFEMKRLRKLTMWFLFISLATNIALPVFFTALTQDRYRLSCYQTKVEAGTCPTLISLSCRLVSLIFLLFHDMDYPTRESTQPEHLPFFTGWVNLFPIPPTFLKALLQVLT